MSFAFDWAAFAENDVFLEKCKRLLNVALNKKLPSIIEGPITVSELSWGDEAPTLETLEIGEVGSDRFRGIFKLNYRGNGRITLATKVQANLINVYRQTAPDWTRPNFIGSDGSLCIPLNLTLSDIQMSGIVICVFSRAKGLTCVFRNDPLQSIKVSSTFDGIPGIATFLQSQIENLIGGLFREELPAILYSHSQIWTRQGQDELISQAQRLGDNYLQQHRELQQQLQELEQEKEDEDDQLSFVNILRLEALAVTRRTLALSTPQVATTILRSELSRRHAVAAAAVPVTIDGAQIHDHVHSQAQRLALKQNHKPRRRVLNLRKKKQEAQEATAEETVEPVTRPTTLRTNSLPTTLRSEVIPPASTGPIQAAATAAAVSPSAPIQVSTPVSSQAPTQASTQVPPAPTPIRIPTVPAVGLTAPSISPTLTTQTKAEIERIKSLLYTTKPGTSFFLPNAKLSPPKVANEDSILEVPPPAYVA